jgi:hypothetical protein
MIEFIRDHHGIERKAMRHRALEKENNPSNSNGEIRLPTVRRRRSSVWIA